MQAGEFTSPVSRHFGPESTLMVRDVAVDQHGITIPAVRIAEAE